MNWYISSGETHPFVLAVSNVEKEESAPAPEPRCATCGMPELHYSHVYFERTHDFTSAPTRKPDLQVQPAPEPSVRMSEERFNALCETRDIPERFISEARRARASEDALRHTLDGVTIYLLGPGLFTEGQVLKAAAALRGKA